MTGKTQHIVPRDTGWAVKPEGGARASKLLDNKDDAISHAKRIARNQDTRVVIHRKDGTIQEVLKPRDTDWQRLTATEAGIKPAQHVVPRGNKWAVRTEGKDRADVVKNTKYDAVRTAHKRADKYGSAMVVHDADGTFQRIDNPPHYPSPMSALLHT